MGDEVTKDEPLTTNPNVGGFGQVPFRWILWHVLSVMCWWYHCIVIIMVPACSCLFWYYFAILESICKVHIVYPRKVGCAVCYPCGFWESRCQAWILIIVGRVGRPSLETCVIQHLFGSAPNLQSPVSVTQAPGWRGPRRKRRSASCRTWTVSTPSAPLPSPASLPSWASCWRRCLAKLVQLNFCEFPVFWGR